MIGWKGNLGRIGKSEFSNGDRKKLCYLMDPMNWIWTIIWTFWEQSSRCWSITTSSLHRKWCVMCAHVLGVWNKAPACWDMYNQVCVCVCVCVCVLCVYAWPCTCTWMHAHGQAFRILAQQFTKIHYNYLENILVSIYNGNSHIYCLFLKNSKNQGSRWPTFLRSGRH